MTTTKSNKVLKMTTLALLSAIIVVLQIISTFIKFGPFSITLALTPIIIGAAIYGWKAGTLLGFMFSATVYITGIMGFDGGFVLSMMDFNPIATTILCLGKGTVAGAVVGLIYKPIGKKNKTIAAFISGMVAPIVNTGIFAAGILTIFYDFISSAVDVSGYASPIALLFLGWIGINFVVEFIVNVALGSFITRVVQAISDYLKS